MKTLFICLLMASGCNALPVGESDEALLGVTRIAPPPQFITLTIDAIEPTLPVEQRPVYLHFTLNNSTSKARTGSVQVQFPSADGSIGGINAWHVALDAYASTQGILAFNAPNATASLAYTVHYYDDGATAPSESGPVNGAFPVALRAQLDSESIIAERTADHLVGDNLNAYLTTWFDGAQIDAQGESLGFCNTTQPIQVGQSSPTVDLAPGSSDTVTFDAWIGLMPNLRTLFGLVNSSEQMTVVEEKLTLSADNIRALIPDGAPYTSASFQSDWCGYQPNLSGTDCGGPAYSLFTELVRVPRTTDTITVTPVFQIQLGAAQTILPYRWDAAQIVSGLGSIVYVNGATTYVAPSTPTLAKIALTKNGRATYVYVEVR